MSVDVSINHVVNSKKQAIPTKSLGLKQVVEIESGTIAAGDKSNVVSFTTNSGIIVDELVWSTNLPTGKMKLWVVTNPEANETTPLSDISKNGTNAGAGGNLTPENIVGRGSTFFDIVAYDNDKKHYKFRLKQPFTFTNGFRIIFENVSDTEDMTFSYLVMGREYD